MSTILGHALVGLTVSELARHRRAELFGGRRWPAIFAGLALLPDVDVVLGATLGMDRVRWLAIANRDDPHRGSTHTLVFALAVGLAGSLLVRPSRLGDRRLHALPWLALAVAAHRRRRFAQPSSKRCSCRIASIGAMCAARQAGSRPKTVQALWR